MHANKREKGETYMHAQALFLEVQPVCTFSMMLLPACKALDMTHQLADNVLYALLARLSAT